MMNGPTLARHWITDFFRQDLPTRLVGYRTWWGLDTETLPDPVQILSYEPAVADRWPMLYTMVLGTTSVERIDYDFDDNPRYEFRYNMRTYVWVRAVGSETVTDLRDNLTTVTVDSMIDLPAVSSYNATQTDCSGVIDESTIRIEFSDIFLLKGERMTSAAYIQYDIVMTETITRDPLGVVSAIPSVLVQLMEKTPIAPTVLLASDGNAGELVLNWKAPTWYSAYEVTGYQIEQSIDAGDNWAVIVADTGVPQPTYTATGLTPGDSYMYRVSGINSQGLGAASAPSLDTVAP
jgi:hypothetical protein